MPNLNDVLKNVPIIHRQGNDDFPINTLGFDSRRIEKNDVFFAIGGARADGHRFIGQAIERGARAIVCERPEPWASETKDKNIAFVVVENANEALGMAASNLHGVPSRALRLVGVTGTNGKTTIATSLFLLFKKLGYKAGLLSTIENRIDGQAIPATHTTPGALALNELLRAMVEAGCEYCFMEVSSHALTQYRTAGLEFTGGIFSNLSQDHLDYHLTFDNYRAAKKSFFDDLPRDAFALANADDPSTGSLLNDCGARKFYYGMETGDGFSCHILESRFHGMELDMDGTRIRTGRIGRFNAYNLLAVYASALLLGEAKDRVLAVLGELDPIAGRFESVESARGVTAIIDYAHTPDALENVLSTIHHIRAGNQRIITVVGAGGDRDKTKRPLMARVAARLSDKLVLTSDNPRWEDPERILDDMAGGIEAEHREKVTTIPDRRQAIEAALRIAVQRADRGANRSLDPGDIVLVAGKGHENYQETKGVRAHFDDKEVVTEFFS
ncbi:MAG: UDP-N-acetylmuramoylalanyl-D-glutamate--2,6-diaminopimelate ligase [Candidatus Kentron sp. G]|nr:MAG: UDP-N-acetylmuramoylalanyl-D-glutamate--2,6-diaminopimelate ligase [Candidatus Kentron sp. G]VFN04962.1 MAG: UDP-N-acetylmuramoylalanyl-D-glutamate--2,6-diaminopimelate ligase [Candidatus Kentron sp. G]VFN06261.1 MAG: UDP-N-acetylmuramoylalanyl-D-glutamate--2,6-diaminopimelate ligase [Candidatus Kentron sp. G]